MLFLEKKENAEACPLKTKTNNKTVAIVLLFTDKRPLSIKFRILYFFKYRNSPFLKFFYDYPVLVFSRTHPYAAFRTQYQR